MVSSEDTEQLLKVIGATMKVVETKKEKSIEDIMFEGLESKKIFFPNSEEHMGSYGLIKGEQKKPDKNKTLNRFLLYQKLKMETTKSTLNLLT